MKIIAILLIIISLTKFYVANKDVVIDTNLVKDIPMDLETIEQICKAMVIGDGLVELLSGIFILCL